MKTIEVTETVEIDRPAELVRRQFADVEHHAATGVHAGVTFEVIETTDTGCRYRQATRLGPLRLSQVMRLEDSGTGPLVNTIEQGQFRDGSITFEVHALSDRRSRVDATLRAPMRGPQRLLAPLLRSKVSRSLRSALEEDRADVESGAYPTLRV